MHRSIPRFDAGRRRPLQAWSRIPENEMCPWSLHFVHHCSLVSCRIYETLLVSLYSPAGFSHVSIVPGPSMRFPGGYFPGKFKSSSEPCPMHSIKSAWSQKLVLAARRSASKTLIFWIFIFASSRRASLSWPLWDDTYRGQGNCFWREEWGSKNWGGIWDANIKSYGKKGGERQLDNRRKLVQFKGQKEKGRERKRHQKHRFYKKGNWAVWRQMYFF